jgi:hypothetical protein
MTDRGTPDNRLAVSRQARRMERLKKNGTQRCRCSPTPLTYLRAASHDFSSSA